ncbi:MAG TPA: DHH family phosphoesterase [Candidatus Methanofastidiosa archaeon]|nr:DHH family phosphoesterase [Candidatus Methanofastidiosa archaeon]HPR41925.1 DHH family phosphoesterase [Candidatus Methanofastidiosa archaeon]
MDIHGLASKCISNVLDHSNDDFFLISHMDADGISSCAIMSTALDRAGIEHTYKCVKINELAELEPCENMIFCDLGSGQQETLERCFPDSNITIIDHHQFESSRFECHFNPFLAGIDGGKEISGSGMSYLFAKAMDSSNGDLAPIAIVGAVGDMQNIWGSLEGMNTTIVADGIENGTITASPDLRLYGRFTRPIYKSLQYFSDPPVPGVSGNESNCIALLSSLGIPIKEDDWRTPSDLTLEEKQTLGTELIRRIMSELPSEFIQLAPKLVFGESYTFEREDRYSPLRDASEFSTCLNAAGRNGAPDIGVEVAKGNRGLYLDKLMSLLKTHRRKLARGVGLVESRGIERLDNLQYFDGTGISDTLVGTVTGLLLGSEGTDPFMPLIGYTPVDDRNIKISLRCSKLLIGRNVNMGKILRETSKSYGGEGGGHAFACGAYVPHENIIPFLDDVSRTIGEAVC